MDQDEGVWGTGQWVRTDGCRKLEMGDSFCARVHVTDVTEQSGIISAGTLCVYDELTLYGSGLSTAIFEKKFLAFAPQTLRNSFVPPVQMSVASVLCLLAAIRDVHFFCTVLT